MWSRLGLSAGGLAAVLLLGSAGLTQDAANPTDRRVADGGAEAGDPVAPAQPVVRAQRGGALPLTVSADEKEVEMQFPTRDGVKDTAWKIVWDMKDGNEAAKEGFKVDGREDEPVLFQIKKAYFRPGAKVGWIQVLENAHPSEFYVPYFFQHTRFFDLRDVGRYVMLNAADGGPRSRRLGKDKRVMAEVRDRGLAYKHGNTSRRGEELVLWANFKAGNYTYLVEFCFHDDGTIALRHAPTGYNFFDHFDSAAHMHNCLWRIGVKLVPVSAGKVHNEVSLVRLPYEPRQLGPGGKLDIQPIAHESAHDFDAKEFTRLRVSNPDFSVFPKAEGNDDGDRKRLPISYDLVPTVQGIARHHRNDDEAFSLHDFWVTRADSPVKMYIDLPNYFNGKKIGKAMAGADGVVLWHMSSALHVPRGEDGIWDGNNLDNGQALVSFTTVELRPRNLFSRTPLYKVK